MHFPDGACRLPYRLSFPFASCETSSVGRRHDDSLKFKAKHSSRTDQSTDTPDMNIFARTRCSSVWWPFTRSFHCTSRIQHFFSIIFGLSHERASYIPSIPNLILNSPFSAHHLVFWAACSFSALATFCHRLFPYYYYYNSMNCYCYCYDRSLSTIR